MSIISVSRSSVVGRRLRCCCCCCCISHPRFDENLCKCISLSVLLTKIYNHTKLVCVSSFSSFKRFQYTIKHDIDTSKLWTHFKQNHTFEGKKTFYSNTSTKWHTKAAASAAALTATTIAPGNEWSRLLPKINRSMACDVKSGRNAFSRFYVFMWMSCFISARCCYCLMVTVAVAAAAGGGGDAAGRVFAVRRHCCCYVAVNGRW